MTQQRPSNTNAAAAAAAAAPLVATMMVLRRKTLFLRFLAAVCVCLVLGTLVLRQTALPALQLSQQPWQPWRHHPPGQQQAYHGQSGPRNTTTTSGPGAPWQVAHEATGASSPPDSLRFRTAEAIRLYNRGCASPPSSSSAFAEKKPASGWWSTSSAFAASSPPPTPPPASNSSPWTGAQPVPQDDFQRKAVQLVLDLYAKDPRTLEEAEAWYRATHGRRPPHRFPQWYAFAQEHSCPITPYGKLQRDLDVFRRLSPSQYGRLMKLLQARSLDRLYVYEARGGAFEFMPRPNLWNLWNKGRAARPGGTPANLLERLVRHLPDGFVVAWNGLDEPRSLAGRNSTGPDMPLPRSLTLHSPSRSEHPTWFRARCLLNASDPGQNALHGYFAMPDTFSATTLPVPVFSGCKIDQCFADISIPSEYYYSDYTAPLHDESSWADKRPVAIWRGGTTGGHATSRGEWRSFHRQRFVDRFHRSPRPDVDVGFTYTVQCDVLACVDQARAYTPLKEKVSMATFMQHKYLVDLDGNSFSSRMLQFMRSKSLVFRMKVFNEFLDDLLLPMVHYVPFHLDMSDFLERLDWAKAHDDEARQIAENARAFAHLVLNDDFFECWTLLAMVELADLQGLQ